MATVLQELLEAIETEVTNEYQSAAPTLESSGFGLRPVTVTHPVLVWSVVTSTEDTFLNPGDDYYTDPQIQFAGYSSKKSSLPSIQIVEEIKRIFRNRSLALSTFRCYNINVGSTVSSELVPRTDGWVTFVTITFECGT